MNRRPTWSSKAFTHVVKMNPPSIWVIVEGVDHDRRHYGKLFEKINDSNIEIVLRSAREIEHQGTSAGGKKQLIKIHNSYNENNSLITKNSSGKTAIIFMLDRDRDDYNNSLIESKHIFYTYGCDVETDILMNTNIWEAFCDAYGVDSGNISEVRKQAPKPFESLFYLWQEWLTLAFIAHDTRCPSTESWRAGSTINIDRYSETDEAKLQALRTKILSTIEESIFEEIYKKADIHVSKYGTRILKGRWVASYLHYLVENNLNKTTRFKKTNPYTIISCSFPYIDYSGEWTEEYRTKLFNLIKIL